MRDTFGRQIKYLRLSVTDRCDFRCVYCMAEDMTFLPRHEVLSLEELAVIAEAFVELGVCKIRVTGGEPLIRQNVDTLFKRLGKLPLETLAITTNGSRLVQHAEQLKNAGVNKINVSLDTLDPAKFQQLTRFGKLETVLKGLQTVKKVGFSSVRLNTVAMKQYNDTEIPSLVSFASENDFDIAFIEEMPLGDINSHTRANTLLSSAAIRSTLQTQFELSPIDDSTGGPARYWQLAGTKTRVGFISPMTHNFCEDCNRVRVSATGKLHLCLGNDHAVDLKPVVRQLKGAARLSALKDKIQQGLAIKPERHHFDDPTAPQIVRFMNATGG